MYIVQFYFTKVGAVCLYQVKNLNKKFKVTNLCILYVSYLGLTRWVVYRLMSILSHEGCEKIHDNSSTILIALIQMFKAKDPYRLQQLLVEFISCMAGRIKFNPFTLTSSSPNIVCCFHTFGNNLEIKRKFTKYLKEICSLASDKHFSFM